MSRWIDIADAIKIMACEMYAEAQSQGFDVDSVEGFIPEAKAWLNEAPSIDIVFCKECKYEKRCTTNVHFLADNGLDVIPVRFCSYGEREGE